MRGNDDHSFVLSDGLDNNPAGIKDDKRKFLTMVLIRVRKQHHAAMQNHQM
ncbi:MULTISPECIES: hypothetical protein [unclassified Mesorhizobium]|uniref:hypothetical protein n=1 Tax=unclassified Mesorhizobium TaxID=325217 RepID=UPI0033395F6C